MAEDSWYIQTQKELEKTRTENEDLWRTLRNIQRDHEQLLKTVNSEVDFLQELQGKMTTFEREASTQAEQLSDFMGRFTLLEQAFVSVRGKLAYLLNT